MIYSNGLPISLVCRFTGVDDEGNEALPFILMVRLCNCSGDDHGVCDFEHTLVGNRTDVFQIVYCDCYDMLYTGEHAYIRGSL